ncbi:MAG: hypothetical protein JXP34_24760, partial [Planctomycetes bacterium]|nr:hypothetical protein [Planctomycetota bacterium]
VAKFEERFAAIGKRFEGVTLAGGEIVGSPAEAQKVAETIGDAGGLLVIHLSLGTGHLLARMVDIGLPTIIFAQPFSGHEWMYVPQWQRAGKRVAICATSDLDELGEAVALLSVPARMRASRLLLVGGPAGTPAARSPEKIREKLGTEVVPVTVEQVIEAHRGVDAKLAEAGGDAWIRAAKQVIEPSREEIIKSAQMYFAMRDLMAKERAQAITIRCLGGIPIQTIGYPCLGFSKLCDDGFVGACEADMDSTLTMLLFRYAFGAAGFISDPLFDTAKNALIHAHCTAPTIMDGKWDGRRAERAPYLIRTHRDDNRGASLEVQMRVGQTVTCAKLAGLEHMLISTGRIVEITDFDDRGCRTQITTEVRDARSMLDHWGAGLLGTDMMTLLHRVIFYGDRTRGMRRLAPLLGIDIVEEG